MILRFSIIAMVLCAHALGISGNQLESRSDKRSSSRYCGSLLTNVLHLVCRGQYNPLIVKKSREESITGELMNSDPDFEDGFWLQNAELDEPSFPFRLKSEATALAPRTFRRVLRGAHDECCRKSCSYQEIRSYCAPSK